MNTDAAEDGELLPDVAALDAFVEREGYTGNRRHDQAELDAVRALRPRLRALWGADEDEAVDLVNAMLREGRALPQLMRHDGWDYHLHATGDDAGLDVRLMVEFAMAMVDVIRMKELDRLRICAAPDCDDVLVDLSKNRSRRFCLQGCGNRQNVAAYRARKAASSGTASSGTPSPGAAAGGAA
ncbi:CGNR zinc finger domain-containing protein [Dactylosporangium vinaceum]|uniref:CGNR zinc finger domain-containing protein n=1 Tax=Dactylosporangium vinaceum TaxID=53362 RepID=A0ABV5MA02_9ACTN|nr:CGNR zinc finger domain-containing protein [Dactylosporangium vinaceum]